jgi:hypothetical protein
VLERVTDKSCVLTCNCCALTAAFTIIRPAPAHTSQPFQCQTSETIPQTIAAPCTAGFTIIPRSPTEVYFDVSTEELETRLYNQIYCCDTTADPTCAGGCAPGKPFANPSTWADILNREALRVSRLMFSLRPEGHMFHQVKPDLLCRFACTRVTSRQAATITCQRPAIYSLQRCSGVHRVSIHRHDSRGSHHPRVPASCCSSALTTFQHALQPQANCRAAAGAAGATTGSLLRQWVAKVVGAYSAKVTWPLISMKLDDQLAYAKVGSASCLCLHV